MQPASFDGLTRFLARRTNRRAALAGATIAGVTTLLSHTVTVAQPASPVASPGAGGQRRAAHPDATFLFVQVATSGTWAPKAGAPETFVLTMSHAGETVYFSDRPERLAGSGPTANLIAKIGLSRTRRTRRSSAGSTS